MYDDNDPIDFKMGLHPESTGELEMNVVIPAERVQANERQDRIVNDMWEQYQQYLKSHAVHCN